MGQWVNGICVGGFEYPNTRAPSVSSLVLFPYVNRCPHRWMAQEKWKSVFAYKLMYKSCHRWGLNHAFPILWKIVNQFSQPGVQGT